MRKFPSGFMIGWSQAGFQSEMGLPGSEDPNSDWFAWVHDEENIATGRVSGDLPENGPAYWFNFRSFHENAKKMGMNVVRLGIEWSRLFPNDPGISSSDDHVSALEKLDRSVNAAALHHYREILADLKHMGFHVILNLYHWTMPLWLHDPISVRKGRIAGPAIGWLDSFAVKQFAFFCVFSAKALDDLVDEYSTMNEPNVVYSSAYASPGWPPGYLSFDLSKRARENMIKAHAAAYDMLKSVTSKPVGIIYANASFTPLRKEDERAVGLAETAERWSFLDPLVGLSELQAGEEVSRRLDWIGVNYYSRTMVRLQGDAYRSVPGYGYACERDSISLDGRPTSDVGWEFYPDGLRDVLQKYWARYRVPLYVTENGIADDGDYIRPYYLVSHISSTLEAAESGVDVRGYLHWSLADNYEWSSGFRPRFGLLRVDYSNKSLNWTPSALVLMEIAGAGGIPSELEHLNSIPPTHQLRRG